MCIHDLIYFIKCNSSRYVMCLINCEFMWINIVFTTCLCFHFISMSFPFKGHHLWGPRQESRNVQSSSYSRNYVQVSIIFALSILQIQAKCNSLPFNKFWHSWCDAAIQAVLWSFSNHREREKAAVISNFDMMWFNFDMNMNMTVRMHWLSFSVKGNWMYNKQSVTQYTSYVF